LNNRFFQVLMMPTRASLKFVGMAAHALLRTISKVAGADVVRDAVTFFQAFEGMEEGFRTRANRVRELLTLDSTAFILVASPWPNSVDEAVFFAGKLAESDMSVTALIVNRVQPRFIDNSRLEQLTAIASRATAECGALQDLIDNLAGYTVASDRDERTYGDLVARIAPAPVSRVPLLNTDVHDLDGLEVIADLLFLGDGRGARPSAEAPGEPSQPAS
jgi:anion-transporting  ArsA/GET3 family ATPase